jgi:hypothetical protein
VVKNSLTGPDICSLFDEEVAIVLPFRGIAIDWPTFAELTHRKAVKEGSRGSIVSGVDA